MKKLLYSECIFLMCDVVSFTIKHHKKTYLTKVIKIRRAMRTTYISIAYGKILLVRNIYLHTTNESYWKIRQDELGQWFELVSWSSMPWRWQSALPNIMPRHGSVVWNSFRWNTRIWKMFFLERNLALWMGTICSTSLGSWWTNKTEIFMFMLYF